MLNIYINKSEIPGGMRLVDVNCEFFKLQSLSCDDVTKRLLSNIDCAEYKSSSMFIGRNKDFGALNIDCLSTGCKTALNILYNADTCFSIAECGNNAILEILSMREGNIYWASQSVVVLKNFSCDIQIQGKVFTDVVSAVDYIDKLWEDGKVEF